MKYIVVIPSYKRPEMLQAKTLKTLLEGGVESTRIHIFVATKAEETSYKKIIPSNLYHKIIVGKKGITNQRKFIVKYFPEGEHIVSMDDDVDDLCILRNKKAVPYHELDSFFKSAFERLHKEKLYIFGVHPTYNPFYMKETITTDLKFCIGTAYGFINRYDKDLIPKVGEKEDYETSILYYIKDGGVLRYNNIGIKTKFHNEKGGLGGIAGRFLVNKKAAEYLAKKYPNYARIKIREKTGMYEIALKRQYPNKV